MKFRYVGNNQYPVDTENDMWIRADEDHTLSDIMEKVKTKWPSKDLNKIKITSYFHQQYNVYSMDGFEYSDYVDYIYISTEE